MSGSRSRGPALKAIVFGVVGLLNSEEVAEVKEVGLRACSLREGIALPFADEVTGSHCFLPLLSGYQQRKVSRRQRSYQLGIESRQ